MKNSWLLPVATNFSPRFRKQRKERADRNNTIKVHFVKSAQNVSSAGMPEIKTGRYRCDALSTRFSFASSFRITATTTGKVDCTLSEN